MNGQHKIHKFTAALLIISVVLPTVLFPMPKKASAQWITNDPAHTAVSTVNGVFQGTTATAVVANLGLKLKDFAAWLLRQILMRLAKLILARITQATINWINSDFHGSPLFVQNPSAFFKDIAKNQVKNIIDLIGYDTFRFPFGPQTALNVISSYKSQLATNAQYTLSKVINDPDLLRQYRNDFNYGGWNGFLVNTQYPQNNYLGFQGIVEQNLASQLEGTLQAPAQKVQNALQQSMGFLSPQTCPSNPLYNNGFNEFSRPTFTPPPWNPPSIPGIDQMSDEEVQTYIQQYQNQYENEVQQASELWDELNTCPEGLVSTTPGAVVGHQITDALGSNLRQTELGAALGNSIDAIFDALINHLLDKGLNALSNTISPGSAKDNWSYNGQTLNGTTNYGSSAGTAGTLNITIPQQNVSLTANPVIGGITSTIYDTSRILSGGTAPYGIVSGNTTVQQKTLTAPIPQVPGSVSVIATTQITRNASGTTLTVHGTLKGESSFMVKDSSTPPKTVTINVAVNNVGDLVASPKNITVNVNEAATTTISGGSGTYSVQTAPNTNIALADFAGTNLVITGVARGTTQVVLQDSSTPPKTVPIYITVSAPGELILTQQSAPVGSISIAKGAAATVTISGGTPGYNIDTVVDTTVAAAQISGSTLTIGGVNGGQTSIIITDSSASVKVATLSVTVIGPASGDALGTCVSTSNTQRTTQASCNLVGGTWTADNSTGVTGGSNGNSQCGSSPCGTCTKVVGVIGGKGGYVILSQKSTKLQCDNIDGGSWTADH